MYNGLGCNLNYIYNDTSSIEFNKIQFPVNLSVFGLFGYFTGE